MTAALPSRDSAARAGSAVRHFPLREDPQLRQRARRWYADPDNFEVVPAKPAATVMCLREGVEGVEVFMLRRAASMAFVPGAMVFPGGGVSSVDAAPVPWMGPGAAEWSDRLGLATESARQVIVAAVRELFEETGVLLAGPEGGPLATADPSWQAARAQLVARQVSFGDFLRERSLLARADLISYRARWITPVYQAHRFDTFFFAVRMPPHQVADGHTQEADAAGWLRPDSVLRAAASGEVMLVPPTVVMLEEIAQSSIEDLCTSRGRSGPIVSELVSSDDGLAVRVVLPAATSADAVRTNGSLS